MATLAQKEYAKNMCCATALVILFPIIFIVNMQIRVGASIFSKLIVPSIIAVCFFIAYLIVTFYDKFKPFKLKDYEWALIVFAGAILISAIIFWVMLSMKKLDYWDVKYSNDYSPFIGYIGNSARMEGMMAFFCYFMFFIAGSSITDKKYVKVILGVFIAVLAISCFCAVLEHFGIMYKNSKNIRPKVFCGNPNFFASFTTLGIAVLSAYIVNKKNSLMLIGAFPLYILVCFATIYNNSRSAWIGSALAWASIGIVLIWEFIRNHNVKEFIIRGLLLLICAAIFLSVLLLVIKVFEPKSYATRMESTVDQLSTKDESLKIDAQNIYNKNYAKRISTVNYFYNLKSVGNTIEITEESDNNLTVKPPQINTYLGQFAQNLYNESYTEQMSIDDYYYNIKSIQNIFEITEEPDNYLAVKKEKNIPIGEILAKIYNKTYVQWGSGRGHSFKWGLKMVEENPLFGTGPDNFRFAYPKEAYLESKSAYGKALAFDKAHNEYVHLGATLGIVGISAYLVFVTLVCINGIKGIKKESDSYNDNEVIKKMLLAAVIGYLGQAYFNISVLQVAPFFWTFMGLLVADYFPKRIVKKNKKKA